MKLLLTLLLSSIFFTDFAQDAKISSTPIYLGESYTHFSKVLNENRTLNVYLPAGYSDSLWKKYPVVYLLDGSVNEDFIHVAGIIQFLTFPWVHAIPQVILVGIENVDRKRDYTFPTTVAQDKADYPTTGGSEKFIHYLKQEVLPFVKSNFRIDTTQSVLIGQSLGGLLACEILYKNTDLFNRYLIVSPSLWWDNRSLLSLPTPNLDYTKIYISYGGKEDNLMQTDCQAFKTKIIYVTQFVKVKIFRQNSHADILHAAVLDGLPPLFH